MVPSPESGGERKADWLCKHCGPTKVVFGRHSNCRFCGQSKGTCHAGPAPKKPDGGTRPPRSEQRKREEEAKSRGAAKAEAKSKEVDKELKRLREQVKKLKQGASDSPKEEDEDAEMAPGTPPSGPALKKLRDQRATWVADWGEGGDVLKALDRKIEEAEEALGATRPGSKRLHWLERGQQKAEKARDKAKAAAEAAAAALVVATAADDKAKAALAEAETEVATAAAARHEFSKELAALPAGGKAGALQAMAEELGKMLEGTAMADSPHFHAIMAGFRGVHGVASVEEAKLPSEDAELEKATSEDIAHARQLAEAKALLEESQRRTAAAETALAASEAEKAAWRTEAADFKAETERQTADLRSRLQKAGLEKEAQKQAEQALVDMRADAEARLEKRRKTATGE